MLRAVPAKIRQVIVIGCRLCRISLDVLTSVVEFRFVSDNAVIKIALPNTFALHLQNLVDFDRRDVFELGDNRADGTRHWSFEDGILCFLTGYIV